ncbi:MAG: cytochrome c peroxidase [Vicinamibacterales bacterium]|jgi:cytochrome c peroxidase|nr:cytochrome-c peroxidase [Acidobacteriota bacterium]MDP6372509.1 cytochrome c peroxidase [Vicinamibacterales bacterium]MDP6610455.1 cytochrome c peroxidase [Vicinamibacterales bacterium]HAK53864.1 cytochrome-c peroxidase [Acidobacteriota bacterium]|tara:strand:- start:14482 stop:15594 length:1113 start_codon:yes stop_codon:yes gene_type:complete
MSRIVWGLVLLGLTFALFEAARRPSAPPPLEPTAEAIEGALTPAPEAFTFTLPAGLTDQPLVVPAANPLSAEKVALGELLFFDARLSATKQMSCETCHLPERGWADGLAQSPKFDDSLNARHTPSLYGAGFLRELYWDGRAQGLEAQILAAWEGQMGADPGRIAQELDQVAGYRDAFSEAFDAPPTPAGIVDALASFVRTIHAGDTTWDRLPKDAASLDSNAVGRGSVVFSEVAQCTLCHLPPVYSDTLFHNVGIGMDADVPDQGRAAYLRAAAGDDPTPGAEVPAASVGAFKTPTLRGVADHPPYFHDGHAETLAEAVDLMLAGGTANDALDEKLVPRQLTPEQRLDLLAFLEALSPDAATYPRPVLPE